MSPPQNPSPKSRPALVTPRYVSFGLFAGVIASGLAIAYIAPKYFAAKPQPGGESVPDCWALVVLWFTAWLWWVFPSRVRSVTGKVTDTTPKYILAAFPFFIFLIVLEYALGRNYFKIAGVYRPADSVTSMTAGLFQTLFSVLVPLPHLLSFVPYVYIRANLPVLTIDGLPGGILAMLLADFVYYWFHRSAHEINVLWGVHVTHHSSESYNFSTALRQSALQGFASDMLYVPMAFLFPLEVYSFHKAWNTLYQFWVHTTVIRRLGVLEYIFVTPSHHRVHHDRRVHKNYGGIFIIWDRLFGSFVDEGEDVDPNQPDVPDGDERVVYGILYGVYTWDFFKVQFHHLLDIAHRWTTASGMKDKLKLLLSGPGMRPGMTRTNLAPMNPNVVRLRYIADHSNVTGAYIIIHFLTAVAVSAVVLELYGKGLISYTDFATAVLFVLWMFHCHGRMLDGNCSAAVMEKSRLLTTASVALFLATQFRDQLLEVSTGALYYVMLAAGVVNASSFVLALAKPDLLKASSHVVEQSHGKAT